MLAQLRMITVLTILILTAIPHSQLSNNVAGDIVPDYFLELEDTVVHLSPDNNYLDDFSLLVHNVCIHSLRIEVTISASGISVSPQFSTISLAPYMSDTIPVEVATTFGFPHSVNQITILSEVTHADGIPVSIKERTAQVVAYVLPYQNVSADVGTVQVSKGGAETFEVRVTNEGNFVDYYRMWFYDNDWIYCTPSANVIRVEPGETVGFPAVVLVSKDVPDSPEDLEYRIESLNDPSLRIDGVVPIEITEGGESRNGISPAVSSGILISGLILLLFALRYLEPFHTRRRRILSCSKLHRSFQQGTVCGLYPLSRSTIQNSQHLRSFRTFGISFLLVMGMLFIPCVGNAQGQITPEIDVVTNGSITLDVSPRGTSLGIASVTISTSSSVDSCVRVTIEAPGYTFGYVNEHLIPAFGSTTFFVGTVALKGSPYRVTAATVFAEVIEVAGIPFTGASDAQAGFVLLVSPYSLPMVTMENGYTEIKKDKPVNVDISVQNGGNALDEFEFWTLNRHRLEDDGMNLSADPESILLNASERKTVSLTMTQVEDVEDEVFFLDLRVISLIDDEKAESTLLIIPMDVIQEEENDPPVAKIESVSPNPATDEDTIYLHGSGTDDGEVVLYQWISSIDGELYFGEDPMTTVGSLTPDDHTISLRVKDDEGAWSDDVTTILIIEESVPQGSEPTVSISGPSEGEMVSGLILIEGTASVDEGKIKDVEISISNGPWIKVAGTKSWRSYLDTVPLPNGPYVLSARSYDGNHYSDNATVNITIWNDAEPSSDGDSDDDLIRGFSGMAVIGAIGVAIVIASGKKR